MLEGPVVTAALSICGKERTAVRSSPAISGSARDRSVPIADDLNRRLGPIAPEALLERLQVCVVGGVLELLVDELAAAIRVQAGVSVQRRQRDALFGRRLFHEQQLLE